MANKLSAVEELVAAPLPDMIKNLALGVAEGNEQLGKADQQILFCIDKAEIELNIAISIAKTEDFSVGGGANINVFNVNASYKSTYGFKEDASSKIKIYLSAKPKGATPI